MQTPPSSPVCPLVFIGHPGHELRIYGWLALNRPEVWVMTDGSGATSRPRTELSRALLGAIGTKPGGLFGEYTDRAIYDAILARDTALFTGLAERLAARVIAGRHDMLVTDSAEGYNPTHDLCELVGAAAAALAGAVSGRRIAHHTFALAGLPDGGASQSDDSDIVLDLDERRAREKIAAAMDYARKVDGTLLKEVEQTLALHGSAVFARERLFGRTIRYEDRFRDLPPFYECYGEERARSGQYDKVIRYGEHMEPLARDLRAFAERCAQGRPCEY